MKKVVLITGASSGLGLATALHLHVKGHHVFGTSRNPENYTDRVPFTMLPLEITDSNAITNCVVEILKKTNRLDVLINNAGVGITGPMEEIQAEAVVANFATNCFGPLQMAQAVLPQMRLQNAGLIINVTSIAGVMGLPFRGVYSASKSALSIMTESLRMEVKSFGIDVCTLAPGDYATDIALRRYHAPVVSNSPYQKIYQENLDTMDAHVDGGNPPQEIAVAIADIIEKGNSKVHYQVGPFMQKLSKTLKNILPSRIFEKLIMNHYKL
ncbi:SDR family oxidoreductase [Flavobacteriaceae bacterium]|nr:SDR family oxidoreductase [Flavobacteriaceae bacterium]